MTTAYMALIETAGNQAFIFDSNRVRQQIGASELIFRSCTAWMFANKHLKHLGRSASARQSEAAANESTQFRADKLLVQPRFDSSNHVEVVVATSGKAFLLCADRQPLQDIIRSVTLKAAKFAPGLDIAGVIQEFDWESDRLDRAYAAAVEELEQVRIRLAPVSTRFPQLPVLRRDQDSALPASQWVKAPGSAPTSAESAEPGNQPITAKDGEGTSPAKLEPRAPGHTQRRRAAVDATTRIHELSKPAEMPGTIEDLEALLDGDGMLAVVHADGNGVGAIFQDLWRTFVSGDAGAGDAAAGHESASIGEHNRRYVDHLRRFSLGLELVTEDAWSKALCTVQANSSENGGSEGNREETAEGRTDSTSVVRAVPILLGGDDVTFVSEAKVAIPLTQAFIQNFCAISADPTLCDRFGSAHKEALAHTFSIGAAARGVGGKNQRAQDRSASVANGGAGDERGAGDEGAVVPQKSLGFGMGAGIVAVHRHFPVFAAYHLAEELTKSAKQTKRIDVAIGALDFHVLYDSIGGSLATVRAMRQSSGRGDDVLRCWGGPYIVHDPTSELDPAHMPWVEAHRLDELGSRKRALANVDRSSSLLHSLRECLLAGRSATDVMVRSMAHRGIWGEATVKAFGHGRHLDGPNLDGDHAGPPGGSVSDDSRIPILYHQAPREPGEAELVHSTQLLDLIDLEVVGYPFSPEAGVTAPNNTTKED